MGQLAELRRGAAPHEGGHRRPAGQRPHRRHPLGAHRQERQAAREGDQDGLAPHRRQEPAASAPRKRIAKLSKINSDNQFFFLKVPNHFSFWSLGSLSEILLLFL